MARRRDDFSAAVKRILGSRVAFRCCFPDCGILTIGPKSLTDAKAINIGEAAHIHSASPGGPRDDPKMTPAERSAISNGIWMCRHHARLIDADEGNYSAETIRQWKEIAEAETYRQLKELTKVAVPEPTTVICLHPKLMFEGIWAGVTDDSWRFVVKEFIYGDLNTLREFQVSHKGERKDYIIVESQGDGRLIYDTFSWKPHGDKIEFSVKVYPSAIRRKPDFIGTSLAYPIELEQGRPRMISGRELAIQKIGMLLNENQGTRFMNHGYGTFFAFYYRDHKNNPTLLNRLVKVELTRLISIPTNPEKPAGQPELNFINRIHEVRVQQETGKKVPVWISLEWGDGTSWEGTIDVYLDDREPKDTTRLPPPIFLPGAPVPEKEPLAQLRELTNSLTGDELTVKKNEATLLEIFREVLPAIMDKATQLLDAEIFPLFTDHRLSRTFDHNNYEYNTSYDLELHLLKHGLVHEMGLHLSLKGFKKAGIRAFDIYSDLFFYFNDYNYSIGKSQMQPWLTKLYHQMPVETEIEKVANDFINNVIRQINEQILAIH